MMKVIEMHRPGVRLGQLTDDLFVAFPGWSRPSQFGGAETDVRVELEGDTLTLTIPEEDERAVRTLVSAHAPRPVPDPPDLDALLDAVENAATLAAFRKAYVDYERAKHPERKSKGKR